MFKKVLRRNKRIKKIRSRISGTADRPRFAVNRSNQHIFAQLIDDKSGKTILALSDLKIAKGTKSEKAKQVGEEIAKIAKTKKITEVVFDRRGFKFHGRIKELAEGARAGGLNF
jgi:large subunit ribosomal protein L18